MQVKPTYLIVSCSLTARFLGSLRERAVAQFRVRVARAGRVLGRAARGHMNVQLFIGRIDAAWTLISKRAVFDFVI